MDGLVRAPFSCPTELSGENLEPGLLPVTSPGSVDPLLLKSTAPL